jgi:hypothetical protein
VTDGNLAAIQARVGQLAAMLASAADRPDPHGGDRGAGGATSAGTGFAGALALALRQAGATSGVDGAADSAQLGQAGRADRQELPRRPLPLGRHRPVLGPGLFRA